ncbi:hypothetical protein NKG94_42895 [Micromonospora sp. M12]
MFTSCQPCPMCATAIDRSGLGRVVYALSSEQFEEVKPVTRRCPRSATRAGAVRRGAPADRRLLLTRARGAVRRAGRFGQREVRRRGHEQPDTHSV